MMIDVRKKGIVKQGRDIEENDEGEMQKGLSTIENSSQAHLFKKWVENFSNQRL